MRGIAKLWKTAVFVLINLTALLPGVVVVFLPGKKVRLKAGAVCMSLWAKCTRAVLGVRISRTGLTKIPSGSFIVANHCSYLDVPVLGSLVPCVFVAKKDIRSWFLVGWLAKRAGTVFVNRASRMATRRALGEVEDRLSSGTSVIVFPEATTNNGTNILTFKSSLFKAPAKQNSPVLPVSIVYSRIDGKPVGAGEEHGVAWYGTMSLLPHLWKVLGMRSIDVTVHINPDIRESMSADQAVDRKLFSAVAHKIVKAGYNSILAKADR